MKCVLVWTVGVSNSNTWASWHYVAHYDTSELANK